MPVVIMFGESCLWLFIADCCQYYAECDERSSRLCCLLGCDKSFFFEGIWKLIGTRISEQPELQALLEDIIRCHVLPRATIEQLELIVKTAKQCGIDLSEVVQGHLLPGE